MRNIPTGDGKVHSENPAMEVSTRSIIIIRILGIFSEVEAHLFQISLRNHKSGIWMQMSLSQDF